MKESIHWSGLSSSTHDGREPIMIIINMMMVIISTLMIVIVNILPLPRPLPRPIVFVLLAMNGIFYLKNIKY